MEALECPPGGNVGEPADVTVTPLRTYPYPKCGHPGRQRELPCAHPSCAAGVVGSEFKAKVRIDSGDRKGEVGWFMFHRRLDAKSGLWTWVPRS